MVSSLWMNTRASAMEKGGRSGNHGAQAYYHPEVSERLTQSPGGRQLSQTSICLALHTLEMSQIEETLARIAKMGGVEGFVITDSEGVVVRQSKSFTDEQAAMYSLEVLRLTNRARHFVRDLDPKVRCVNLRRVCLGV